MTELGRYVVSVAAAAVICAIVLAMVKNGGTSGAIRLICGLFLTFAVIRPVTHLALGDFEALGITWEQQAEEAAQVGEEMARESLQERIKQDSEAYILDKAQALGAELQAEVTVSSGQPPLPISVELTGEVPPYLRQLLSRIIKVELGIPKERQKWIS